ncbi:hypothetical protein D3C78_973170 [compost metagenome]
MNLPICLLRSYLYNDSFIDTVFHRFAYFQDDVYQYLSRSFAFYSYGCLLLSSSANVRIRTANRKHDPEKPSIRHVMCQSSRLHLPHLRMRYDSGHPSFNFERNALIHSGRFYTEWTDS